MDVMDGAAGAGVVGVPGGFGGGGGVCCGGGGGGGWTPVLPCAKAPDAVAIARKMASVAPLVVLDMSISP
jgi:hypothetical protein